MPDPEKLLSKAVGVIFSKMKAKILKGEFSDLMKTPAPSNIHANLTQLEITSRDVGHFPHYLNKVTKETTPLEGLKLVIAAYVGGHNIAPGLIAAKVPLNPILGETVQRRLNDGTTFCAEQICHHPPISAFILQKDDEWSAEGHFEYKAWPTGLNSVKGAREGRWWVELNKTGQKIKITDPQILLDGIVKGPLVQTYEGNTYMVDYENKLKVVVEYNPFSRDSYIKSFKGIFKKKQETRKKDELIVKIYKFEESETEKPSEENIVCTGTGSWLSHIDFEGKEYWRLTEPICDWLEDVPDMLPSDSLHRADLQKMKAEEWEEAETAKVELEELQRSDKKLRQTAETALKKKQKK